MKTKHISKYHLRLSVLAAIFTALVWQVQPAYVDYLEGVSERLYLAELTRVEAEVLLARQEKAKNERTRVEARKQAKKKAELQRAQDMREEDIRIMEEVHKNNESGEVPIRSRYWKRI